MSDQLALPVSEYAAELMVAVRRVAIIHRRLQDLVKHVLDSRAHEGITPTQAMMIFHIGDKEVRAADLKTHGFYLGSNVSHNLKKLVEEGLIESKPARHDRRVTCLKLTEAGLAIHAIVLRCFILLSKSPGLTGAFSPEALKTLNDNLHRFEKACTPGQWIG